MRSLYDHEPAWRNYRLVFTQQKHLVKEQLERMEEICKRFRESSIGTNLNTFAETNDLRLPESVNPVSWFLPLSFRRLSYHLSVSFERWCGLLSLQKKWKMS